MKWRTGPQSPNPPTAQTADTAANQKKKRAGGRWYLLPLACCLLCFGGWLLMMAQAVRIEQETAELRQWCQAPENRQPYESAMEQNSQNERLKAELGELHLLEERLARYPLLDGAWLDRVLQSGGPAVSSQLLGYHAHQGELLLRAESEQPIEPAVYVSALEKNGGFQQVEVSRSTFERGLYVLELRAVLQPREPQ